MWGRDERQYRRIIIRGAWLGPPVPGRTTPQVPRAGTYAGSLASIEINGSFYALQRPSSYELWRGQTPDGFVFSVKGPRFVTHLKKLADVEVPLANFFASGLLALAQAGPHACAPGRGAAHRSTGAPWVLRRLCASVRSLPTSTMTPRSISRSTRSPSRAGSAFTIGCRTAEDEVRLDVPAYSPLVHAELRERLVPERHAIARGACLVCRHRVDGPSALTRACSLVIVGNRRAWVMTACGLRASGIAS